jgi:hypothetical protein
MLTKIEMSENHRVWRETLSAHPGIQVLRIFGWLGSGICLGWFIRDWAKSTISGDSIVPIVGIATSVICSQIGVVILYAALSSRRTKSSIDQT